MYPQPNVYTCTARVWLREIGFSLTYGALMLKTWRISVIFRVRSAKAVKITDVDLLKRVGVIVMVFSVFLVIRTLVAPSHVIVGRTADDLKAFLCKTDWWDHSFTSMEVMFLVWGIRLCIVVRKAPSEFNESRFISMAIYNEFLLSLFLNISMLFLQKPANPDLLYIIFFCHTQLTVTLLLCLIFGSKAYMVFKGHGKMDENSSMAPKPQTAKFLSKARSGNSQCVPSTNSSTTLGMQEYARLTDTDVQEEFQRLYVQLETLKERNMRLGNRHLVAKISAMQEAAKQNYNDTLIEEEPECHNTDHIRLNNVLAEVTEKIVNVSVPDGTSPGSDSHRKSCNQLKLSPKKENCAHSIALNELPSPKELNLQQIAAVKTTEIAAPVSASVDWEATRPLANSQMSEQCDRTVDIQGKRNRHRKKRNKSSDNKCCEMNAIGEDDDGAAAEEGAVKLLPSESTSPCKCAESNQSPSAKGGLPRTRAIVINLDDKNRFSEEVTV